MYPLWYSDESRQRNRRELSLSKILAADEWENSHIPSPFNSGGQSPLMARASMSIFSLRDFRLTGNKPAKQRHIFIIYNFYILRTKLALVSHIVLKW